LNYYLINNIKITQAIIAIYLCLPTLINAQVNQNKKEIIQNKKELRITKSKRETTEK